MAPSREDVVLSLQRAGTRERTVAFHPRASKKSRIWNRNRSDRCVSTEISAQSGEGQIHDLPDPSSEFSASLTGPGLGASATCQQGCVPSPQALGAHPTPGQLSSFDNLAAASFEIDSSGLHFPAISHCVVMCLIGRKAGRQSHPQMGAGNCSQ